MRGSRINSSGMAGFTLLELLVGIALLGLIATLLLSGVQLGTASRDRVAQTATELEDLRLVETFLRSRLQQALPYHVPARGDRPQIAFSGNANSVKFLVGSLFRDDARGIREVRIVFERARDAGRLMAYDAAWTLAEDFAITKTVIPSGGAHVLVDGVDTATFSYFGASPTHAQPRWHQEWRATAALPRLVRLELQAGGTALPPVTVATVLRLDDR